MVIFTIGHPFRHLWWQQADDHKGGENVGGQSLVQHEIQLSYSSHLARMARRSSMSE